MSADITSETIKTIIEESKPEIFKDDGHSFSSKRLYHVSPPNNQLLNINSLTSLCNFLKVNSGNHYYVVVESPQRISILKKDFMQRSSSSTIIICETPIDLDYDDLIDCSQEDFLLHLSTKFEPSKGDVDLLAKIASCVTAENIRDSVSNGITQEVVIKENIATKANVKLKPIWSLYPYRTFPEIDQPECRFVLRIKKDSSGQSVFHLKASSSELWKSKSMDQIRGYIASSIPDNDTIVIL